MQSKYKADNRKCIHIIRKAVQEQINRALAVQDPKIVLKITKYALTGGIFFFLKKTEIKCKTKQRKILRIWLEEREVPRLATRLVERAAGGEPSLV